MGGYPGAVNRYRFTRDSDVLERMRRSELVGDIDELKGASETLQLRQQDFTQARADAYAVLWSAAGGFGDPLERDPGKVEADVANGDVSEKAAREIYGVVIGDAQATMRQREELRAARLQNSNRVAKKLTSKISFLATESLAVRGKRWSCARCAADLGPLKSNYKDACVRLDRPIESSNPIVGDPSRFIDPLPRFRQFCCPGCGRLIENEIALEDDPLLMDVELRRQSVG